MSATATNPAYRRAGGRPVLVLEEPGSSDADGAPKSHPDPWASLPDSKPCPASNVERGTATAAAVEHNVVSDVLKRNIDLDKVHRGEHPDSWDNVRDGIVQIIEVASNPGQPAGSDQQHQSQGLDVALSKHDKEQLFRIISHCDCLGSGKIAGKDKAYIDAFFQAIHGAAKAVFDPLPHKLAQMAKDMGCDKELAMDPPLPVFPKFDPLATEYSETYGDYMSVIRSEQSLHQALHVHWLGEAFEQDLAKFFAEKHPDANSLEVCATTLILQSACVNGLFQSEVEKIAAPFGNFRSAAIKGIPRALEKVTNPLDYFGPNGVPPGKCWDETHDDGIKPSEYGSIETEQAKAFARNRGSVGAVVDSIRCSLETDTNTTQERFVHTLREHHNGSVFQVQRQKSTLHTLSDVKQCLVNVLYTPRHPSGDAVTFNDMVRSTTFMATTEAVRKDNGISENIFAACLDLLRHPSLVNKPIQLICETQLYLSDFLRARKEVHAYYKMARSDNLMSLTMDCISFASFDGIDGGMACSQDDVAGRLLLKLLALDIFSDTWDLENRGLGDDHARILGELLADNQTLRKLSLNRNRLSDAGVCTLLKQLAHNNGLTTLNLKGNGIGAEAHLAIMQWVIGAPGRPRTTDIDLNPSELTFKIQDLIQEFGPNIMRRMLQSNYANAILASMRREGKKVSDQDAHALGEGLAKNSTLTLLDLDKNQISDDGAHGLGEGLSKNSTLTLLYLNGNQISDDGARGLGEGLAKNSTLTELDLDKNQISDDGACGLGEGLAKNSTLTRLFLNGNQISDDGARGLAEGLAKNRHHLTKLYLHENQMSDAGARGLAEGLAKNSTLTVLCLGPYNNSI